MNKKHFIAIWLSNLEIDLILMENPHLRYKPVCILRTYRQQKFIFKVNYNCKSSNLIAGKQLTDAIAIEPNLIVKKALPLEKKKLYLNKIIFWLSSIAPRISVAKNSTLILDLSHTFKGSYVDKIKKIFKNSLITAQVSIADTVGAAWAKSHFLKKDMVGDLIEDSIFNLPIKSLRISYSSVKKLTDVGIETISQLEKIPKNDLYLRFDNEVPNLFDKATGKEDEYLPIVKTKSKFQAKIDLFVYPSFKHQVICLTKKLIMALCIKLKNSHVNAQNINIIFNSEKKLQKIININLTKPTNSHTPIVTIFVKKLLEQKNIPEIQNIKVETPKTYPVLYKQKELLDSNALKEKKITPLKIDDNDISQLIEKLGSRLGKDSVKIFSPGESHVPEKSYIFKLPSHNLQTINWPMQNKPRPKILFEPQPIIMLKQIPKSNNYKLPKLFYWGGQKYKILKAIGPERISSDWWLTKRDNENSERDYWQVKSTCGSHLWLFNSKKKLGINSPSDKWLIQGQFS
ncbi:MAG: hypothetical protein P8L82_05135 [Paracoccaceae bacterium]|nr:hypothetical protein [Paracoccaceae bacterium]